MLSKVVGDTVGDFVGFTVGIGVGAFVGEEDGTRSAVGATDRLPNDMAGASHFTLPRLV